jgi:hypothetical protein
MPPGFSWPKPLASLAPVIVRRLFVRYFYRSKRFSENLFLPEAREDMCQNGTQAVLLSLELVYLTGYREARFDRPRHISTEISRKRHLLFLIG